MKKTYASMILPWLIMDYKKNFEVCQLRSS